MAYLLGLVVDCQRALEVESRLAPAEAYQPAPAVDCLRGPAAAFQQGLVGDSQQVQVGDSQQVQVVVFPPDREVVSPLVPAAVCRRDRLRTWRTCRRGRGSPKNWRNAV